MKRICSYLKMRVLGAIDFAEGKTIRDRIRAVSQMGFKDEDGVPHRFTWRTIETWLCRYRKHGITAMQPRPRGDRGAVRKVNLEALQEAIDAVRHGFHKGVASKAAVYRACIEAGLLRRECVAPNTFSRLVKQYDLLKAPAGSDNRARLAFAKQFANQMWQADTLFGPHVKTPAGPVPTRLIAFIDDASRVVCHAAFFLAETIEALVSAFRGALYKRGIPESLYADNGSIYTSREIVSICARLGVLLIHAPHRDAAAKGKIERWFRTVRDGFLTRALDLSSIEALNRQLTIWVEEEYNAKPHATLGMRPIDRFGLDLPRIRFLPPNPANDEIFFAEETRTVRADNTFSFRNTRFEAPADLRGRQIQIRFDRSGSGAPVVYFKADRIGPAAPVDFCANDRRPNSNPTTQNEALP